MRGKRSLARSIGGTPGADHWFGLNKKRTASVVEV
jgi:hypothetical protein